MLDINAKIRRLFVFYTATVRDWLKLQDLLIRDMRPSTFDRSVSWTSFIKFRTSTTSFVTNSWVWCSLKCAPTKILGKLRWSAGFLSLEKNGWILALENWGSKLRLIRAVNRRHVFTRDVLKRKQDEAKRNQQHRTMVEKLLTADFRANPERFNRVSDSNGDENRTSWQFFKKGNWKHITS